MSAQGIIGSSKALVYEHVTKNYWAPVPYSRLSF